MRCDKVVALGAGAVFVGIVKSSDISMAKEGGMIAILVRPVLSKVRVKYSKYVVIATSISPETWASISFFEYLCGAKRVDAMHHRSAYQSHASQLRRTFAACRSVPTVCDLRIHLGMSCRFKHMVVLLV